MALSLTKEDLVESFVIGLVCLLVGNQLFNVFESKKTIDTSTEKGKEENKITKSYKRKNKLNLFLTGFFLNLIITKTNLRQGYCDKKIYSGLTNLPGLKQLNDLMSN
tara:strand:+ start:208 stop:528 length:321 start_codon:yes stop_codon:yes gene_type:complete